MFHLYVGCKGSDDSSSSSQHIRKELVRREKNGKRLRHDHPGRVQGKGQLIEKKRSVVPLLSLAKKAKEADGSCKVLEKSESLMRMEKSKYEALRWNNDPYEDGRKHDACPPMFRTVIQQKIFEEVILALDTKIAPQKAIDFVQIGRAHV